MQSLGGVAQQAGDTTTTMQILQTMKTVGPRVEDLLRTRDAGQGGGEEE